MPDKTDFQDYHKYSWQVLSPPFNFSSFIKTRIFYILPLLILFFFLSKYLTSIQNIIVSKDLHIFFYIICLIILLVIVILDYSISKSFDREISHFSISQQGIVINQKIIPLDHLAFTKLPNIDHLKEKKSYLYLKIPTKSLSLKLKFTSKEEVNKFLNALKTYCSP